MKKKLTHNLGMKILSLAIASIMWIVIINIDDPVITRTFPQISVEIKNEEAINSLNQVYEVVTGDVVNITVKGKRSVVDTLRTSDFKATADLSKLSSVYAVPIEPSITKNVDNDVELLLGKVDTLIVKLEDVSEKQFQVTVVEQGDVDDGYSIGDIKVKPNLIRVTGAKSQISRIDQVRVELDVSNASDAIEEELEPKVYDSNGYLIDSSNMKFSSTKIKVTADLLNTKTVPLVISTTGEPSSDYKYVSMDYEPKKITIAGKQSNLEQIKYIDIKLDITGAKEHIEEEINVVDYLPEDIKLVSDGQTAMVNIKIEKLNESSFTFGTSDIEVKNLPTNLIFSYTNPSSITVVIKGLYEDVNKIHKNNLNAYIDLEKLKKGKHNVKIQFDLGEDIEIVTPLNVSVQLSDEDNLEQNTDISNEDSTLVNTKAPTVSPNPTSETTKID